MFTNLKDALHYIENRRAKHTFEYFKQVLDDENIDYQLPCIHVTGTNGKGGTIRFIASILEKANYKVGTFTSPYMVCHQDRFCINGQMMSEDDLLHYINLNVDIIEKYGLAMFEIDFIIMLQYFKQKQIDVAMIEVGIGGRNDKTNMISPMASIITNIGHDHLSQIGPTLKDVAFEKAGIIKQQTPVFTSMMEDELLEVLSNEATLKEAPLYIVNEKQDDLSISMQGQYHQINAKMAKLVVETVFPHISQETIQTGLYDAFWPGRFEYFKLGNSDVYLDGAHNLEAMQTLLNTVKAMSFEKKPTFIYTALQDKDFKAMADLISKEYDLALCLFEDGRALNQDNIQLLNIKECFKSIDEAIWVMKENPNTYVVCGSLHFISQIHNKIIQK